MFTLCYYAEDELAVVIIPLFNVPFFDAKKLLKNNEKRHILISRLIKLNDRF